MQAVPRNERLDALGPWVDDITMGRSSKNHIVNHYGNPNKSEAAENTATKMQGCYPRCSDQPREEARYQYHVANEKEWPVRGSWYWLFEPDHADIYQERK